MAYWSYKCGLKGLSAVRVYERSVSSALYIEWFVTVVDERGRRRRKRVQRALRDREGNKVANTPRGRQLAVRIAREYAAQAERHSHRQIETALFGETDHTLSELLARYHRSKEQRWSPQEARSADRFRRFWLDAFGPECPITQVRPAAVEDLVAAMGVSDETKRKHLVYIKAAYRYGRRKLGWLGEGQDLAAVDTPRVRYEPIPAYARDEALAVLRELEKIGPGPAWMGHVAFQAGRRDNAIRHVRKEDVLEVHEDYSVVRFRAEYDKARKESVVALRGRAHELTVQLLREPGEWMLGKEVPNATHCLRRWLRKAEQRAGVPYKKRRGWHGFKKRYATEAEGIPGFDDQANTRKETLKTHYTQDELERKLRVAEHMASLMEVGGSDG